MFQTHSDKSFIQLILFIIFKRVYKKQKHVIGCNMSLKYQTMIVTKKKKKTTLKKQWNVWDGSDEQVPFSLILLDNNWILLILSVSGNLDDFFPWESQTFGFHVSQLVSSSRDISFSLHINKPGSTFLKLYQFYTIDWLLLDGITQQETTTDKSLHTSLSVPTRFVFMFSPFSCVHKRLRCKRPHVWTRPSAQTLNVLKAETLRRLWESTCRDLQPSANR